MAGQLATILFRTFCACVLAFLIAPILVIMPLSFSSEPWFTYPLPGVSLRWYENLFGDDRWRDAITNSLIVAVGSTTLSTVFGTLAAVGLSRANLPWRGLILGIIISPMIVPVVITGAALFFGYSLVGLNNTYAGIILAHTILSVPFVVITVTASLAGFDGSLMRAAANLGATPLKAFRLVMLPLIAPGVISGALFAFVTSWDEVVTVLFIASPTQRTLPMQMFSGIREQISPTITAAATLLILIAVSSMVALELLRRRAATNRVEP